MTDAQPPPEIYEVQRLERGRWVSVVSGPKSACDWFVERRQGKCPGGPCRYRVVKVETMSDDD